MLITKSDGEITEDMQRITKIRDTTLVSCANKDQPNMFEREVVVVCVFVWADCIGLIWKDAKSWKNLEEGWGKKYGKEDCLDHYFLNIIRSLHLAQYLFDIYLNPL